MFEKGHYCFRCITIEEFRRRDDFRYYLLPGILLDQ